MLTYTFACNKASWSSTLTSNLLVIVVKLLHCNCNISNLDIGLLTTVLEDVTWLTNDGHDVSSNLRLRLGLRKEWDKWLVILFIKEYFLLNIFLVAWPYVTSNLFSNLITLQHRPFYTIFLHYAYLEFLQGIPQFVFEAFLLKKVWELMSWKKLIQIPKSPYLHY